MGFGGCGGGEANAVFGSAAKRGRGGGATAERETGATGAGKALICVAIGGGTFGLRGEERRDRATFGDNNGIGGGEVWAAILRRGVGARVGSAAEGIFSFERGMLRGGGANNPPPGAGTGRRAMPPGAGTGRRAITGREGRRVVFRYKSGRFCLGPSASSTPKSTLAAGLPY
jgi:hypothetical protein